MKANNSKVKSVFSLTPYGSKKGIIERLLRPEKTSYITQAVGLWMRSCGIPMHYEIQSENSYQYQLIFDSNEWKSFRFDLIGLDIKDRVVIVEVKSCLEDFLRDKKWPNYLNYSNLFYLAVSEDFPFNELPNDERIGLISVSDECLTVLRFPKVLKAYPHTRNELLTCMANTAEWRILSQAVSEIQKAATNAGLPVPDLSDHANLICELRSRFLTKPKSPAPFTYIRLARLEEKWPSRTKRGAKLKASAALLNTVSKKFSLDLPLRGIPDAIMKNEPWTPDRDNSYLRKKYPDKWYCFANSDYGCLLLSNI